MPIYLRNRILPMNRTSRQTFVACLIALLLVPLAALHANDEPQKSLPLSGEVFLVEGRTP